MYRRQAFLTLWIALAIGQLPGQQLFPVKQDGLWGLIDAAGNLQRQAVFDLIGKPDAYGYLMVQQGNFIGLLHPNGQELLPPQYDDVQVVDKGLFSVLSANNWRLINEQGACLLEAGEYQQIRKLSNTHYAFRKGEKWGLVDRQGQQLTKPTYDNIRLLGKRFFEVTQDKEKGLLDDKGQLVLAPLASRLVLSPDSLVFYQQKGKWGANRLDGQLVFPANYDHYRRMGKDYIILQEHSQKLVYSLPCQRLFSLAAGEEVLPFSDNYIAVSYKGKMGLFNRCGQRVLASQYQEIQPFSIAIFRVREEAKWGLLAHGDQLVLDIKYDYISPLEGQVASLLQDDLYGLINFKGEVLHPPCFSKVELAAERIHTYTGIGNGARLQRYHLNAAAQLVGGVQSSSHYQIKIAGTRKTDSQKPNYAEKSSRFLPKFEWFYETENSRWGLRDRISGQVVYAPTFSDIEVLPDIGLTLVALPKTNAIELERTSFKAKLVFGLLLNEEGKLVTGLDIIDLRLEDWDKGLAAARCMFDNGKFGLIAKNGHILKRDLAYIGNFEEGRAAVSASGKISGSLLNDTPNSLLSINEFLGSLRTNIYLLDYTSYDQAFAQQAQLICENCQWGFISNTGKMLIPPTFEAVEEFQNGHAVVRQNAKYGLIDTLGNWVVKPQFDAIDRLPQTQGFMAYRLQKKKHSEGLIDTLGQLILPPQFEEVGPMSEGLVAVKQQESWGYANDKGDMLIPFGFAGAKSFSESHAAVKTKKAWGHINDQGNFIYPIDFAELGSFKQGLAWASNGQAVGYIDTSGHFKIPPVFQKASDFCQGVAIVQQANSYGIINQNGDWVLKPKYLAIEPFQSNGIAIAQLAAERFVLINKDGKLLTNHLTYKEIAPFKEGLALVKNSNGYGFIEESGRERIAPKWSWAASFSNGRAVVKQNGRCGYIDTQGRLLIPCKYAQCLDFTDGKAAVFMNIHNAGIIDLQGTEIVAPNLNRMIDYHQGMGLMKDDKQGYYFITPQAIPSYEAYYEEARSFQHGVAAVRKGGKWGLISEKGLALLAPKFSDIGPFEKGLARVEIDKLYGLIGSDGQWLLPAEFHFLEAVAEGIYRVEKDNQIGYFSQEGYWLWPLAQ